ncbi:phosphotransferase family protein [Clostridium oryzae]|uniref:Phosphotransferase enzyme family protein n=1 Tax=Clostridium oryzae TaxID=1450648 RepID=A0A1V4I9D7_9CLOT|nr:phosphotransferase [Clostridium oryzae]OPJ56566.1 phosphotransferase enzyme family protein [Clostridium oryzae]
MKSLTKNKQTIETINEMADKAFNGSKVSEITELKEGFFNVAYRLKLADEREVILKIAPSKSVLTMTYEKNIMFTETETMKLVKNMTDVTVPEIFYYDNSHSICESDYFFMSKLPGASFSSIMEQFDEKQKKKINYKLGQYNAKINGITGENFGYFGQQDKQGKDWFNVFSNMIDDAINDAKALNIDIGTDPNKIKSLLNSDKEIFEEVKVPKLVHWDLWAGNVFIENGEITGLIDFERCLWADELMEVGFRSYDYNEDFYNGYGIGDLTEKQKKRVRWYDMYLFLIWVIEGDYRQYEDRGLYEHAKKKIIETVNLLENV